MCIITVDVYFLLKKNQRRKHVADRSDLVKFKGIITIWPFKINTINQETGRQRRNNLT